MGTTYNGINGSEGGNIFKDVKFWVAQRVPLRSTWVDHIKQNGGLVVPLEKQADMLIADHKRLDAPPGSYSWKFIEDSVKNGIIQIKDKYRIGPDPDVPRPVGARHGAKTTRTPFTKDDDANLAKWVLSRRSQQQQGNAIYQEYEAVNPRHTWQSWRDRFVKRLQPRGMAALERLAAEAPEVDVSEPAEPPAPSSSSPRGATETGQAVRQSEPQAARVPAEPQVARRTEAQPFEEYEPQSVERPRSQPNTVPESAPPERSPSRTRETFTLPQDHPRRQLFYRDLDDYIDASGASVKRRLNIDGTTIELFDLAMAVSASEVDSQVHDWYRVAEIVGIDDADNDAVMQLIAWYEEELADFVAAMMAFEVEDGNSVKPEAEGPEEDPFEQDVPEQASSQWPASYVPSSPPVVIGRKRSAGQRQLSAGHGTKRPRYDKDMVIPSTPDADLDAELPAVENSPSARKSSQWRGYVDESEASQHLPLSPPLQAESQDLGTGQSPITEPRRQSLVAAQEHRREELDPTPIPFSLKRPHEQRSYTNRQAPRAESPRPSRESSSRNGAPRRSIEVISVQPKPKAQTAPRRSLPTSFTSSHSASRQTTTAPPRTETVSRPNPSPRTSQPESTSSNSREIQKRITYYENCGFPRDIVVEALKRTTLTPGNLALQVMESLQAGRGVPSRHEGIWTDRDDADLAFVSMVDFSKSPTNTSEELQQQRAQKAHNRLIKKHTFQRFELRKAFLSAQADQGHSKE
ncbi:hypothetical protein CEP54_015031 [Fusarium duplospermum]|uniref:DNA-binding protein RAP1 n=1 Tax=Fusarium duplospermum TaxID=1325734 RepID=A0A428NS15_9HYPO|nr:hypothetical protein CEP54_015031 [Fusarium duplospermum]